MIDSLKSGDNKILFHQVSKVDKLGRSGFDVYWYGYRPGHPSSEFGTRVQCCFADLEKSLKRSLNRGEICFVKYFGERNYSRINNTAS